jgi:hypothetical protein
MRIIPPEEVKARIPARVAAAKQMRESDTQVLYDYPAQIHGAERARAIIWGKDSKTNADLERWRRLGTTRH